MTPSEDLQRAIKALLEADTDVMNVAHRVYDKVPLSPYGPKKAYVSFGPISALSDDATCVSGQIYTIQVDAWSKADGALECRTLTDLVRGALHHASIPLTDSTLVDAWVRLWRVDPDYTGEHHGVVQLSAMIES